MTRDQAGIPSGIDEVTVDWLSEAMGRTVTDIRTERIAEDSGFSSLLYRAHLNGPDVPSSVIVKLPGAPEARGAMELLGGYRRELEFYRRVATDPPLRELYPEEDLGPAADRLRMFLEQYWGGPSTYHEQRGHPRLRMRHAPFAVTIDQRDRWLTHMNAAIDTIALPTRERAALREYVTRAADFLVNSD